VKLAALALLAMPATAFAEDKPDRSVRDSGDANLESDDRHQNKNVTLGLGGGMSVGMGIDDANGQGGSISLRLAQMATRRMAFTIEATSVILRHRVETTTGMSEVNENVDSNVMLGAQFYINRSLWLRTSAGIGVFVAKGIAGDGGVKRDVTLKGPAGLIGAGLDLIRLRRVSFGIEMMTIGMVNREGLLSTGGFLVNLCVE
jgi:hypothetical protein